MSQHFGAALGAGEPIDAGQLVRHLLRRCPDCLEGLGISRRSEIDSAPLLARAADFAIASFDSASDAFERARPQLDEILADTPIGWSDRIARVPGLRSPLVVHWLRERAHEVHSEDPHEAVALAQAAASLADQLFAERETCQTVDAVGWAQAQLARTLARLARFEESEHHLSLARRCRSIDPLLPAFRLEVAGLLAYQQLDVDKAIPLLDRSIRLYEAVGARDLAARAEIMAAGAHGDVGQLAEAKRRSVFAIAALDSKREPRLMMVALQNYAFYLAGDGETDDALEVLDLAYSHFAAHGKPLDLVRLQWTAARVLMAESRWSEAVGRYIAVCNSFAEHALPMEVASAALEACEALARSERWPELAQLSTVALALERSMGRARGIAAAWLEVHRAVRARSVQAVLVNGALDRLRAATRKT